MLAPIVAASATRNGGYIIPPATTVTIAGAGKKTVREPSKFAKKIPKIPKFLKEANLS